MGKIMRAIGKAVTTSITKVVGGIFSKFRNMVVLFRNGAERHGVPRNRGITQWEESAKYCGWVMAKCYEDMTKSIFYLFAYNKRNENTLTLAVVQEKAIGSRSEMYVYKKDKDTGDIDGFRCPSQYDVKELKEIFE